jgi:uncharacterized protein YneF (UPF0154 family)
MKADAQFPTPINATLTLGIVGTLLGFHICRRTLKSYAEIFPRSTKRYANFVICLLNRNLHN